MAVLVAVLGLFGAVQWRSSVDAKRDVDDLLLVNRLVTASTAQLTKDPELALLLAMQSLRQTVDLGYATEEAVDAVHFALQELGVQYDVDAGTRVAARPGSQGRPVGVYALPPSELIELAESAAPRTLTDGECQEFLSGPCPAEVDVPDDLELRRGFDAYAPADLQLPLKGTTVTICLCGHLSVDTGLARELAKFTERTGIRVVLTPVDPESRTELRTGEPDRRPDVVMYPNEIEEWAHDRAMDIDRFVDPETLRSDFGDYLLSFATSDIVGERACRRRGSSGHSVDDRPEGPRVLPESRVPEGRVPDTGDMGRATRSLRSNRGGREDPMVLRLRGRRMHPAGPAPTFSRVWYFESEASRSTTHGHVARSGSPAQR